MANKPFKFGLQPALDVAIDERRKWELALSASSLKMAEADRALSALRHEGVERQADLSRCKTELSTMRVSQPDQLQWQAELIEAAKLRVEQKNAEIAAQTSVCQELKSRHQVLQSELAKSDAKVKSLEKLRDQQSLAFRKEQEIREQNEADEIGQQLHRRKQP